MKYMAIFSLILLVGCEQRYRYPCQDMDNWDKPMCQKPQCEINRECPEHIFTTAQDKEVMKQVNNDSKCKGVAK
jgi:hypothetical protein